jgi:hypothetical protein
MEKVHTTFDKITEGFRKYQVHPIELWISGLLETDTSQDKWSMQREKRK